MRSSRRSPRTSNAASVLDDPFLDRGDEAAHVRRAALEIEHDIADPLAGTVIGELPAAADHMHRKTRLDQLLRPRGCAGGVKRRVLEQPDQLGRFAARDRRRAGRHAGKRAFVVDRAVAHEPFGRRRAGAWKEADRHVAARVNHLVTMPWSNNMALNLLRQNRRGAAMATLDNVSIDIAVVLGRTAMPIHQALRLGRGAIIELDASEEDEVRILVNNMPVAKGTVIVSGNRIAVEVKKLLLRTPDGA